eukprot:COSAG01_NODE_16683_length_1215_cov_1.192652_2_plen_38_part_01
MSESSLNFRSRLHAIGHRTQNGTLVNNETTSNIAPKSP